MQINHMDMVWTERCKHDAWCYVYSPRETSQVSFCAHHPTALVKGIKLKIRQSKWRSCVNWQGSLEHEGIKECLHVTSPQNLKYQLTQHSLKLNVKAATMYTALWQKQNFATVQAHVTSTEKSADSVHGVARVSYFCYSQQASMDHCTQPAFSVSPHTGVNCGVSVSSHHPYQLLPAQHSLHQYGPLYTACLLSVPRYWCQFRHITHTNYCLPNTTYTSMDHCTQPAFSVSPHTGVNCGVSVSSHHPYQLLPAQHNPHTT